MQLSVIPNRTPQPTAVVRLCRAHAKAAQARTQQLVSGPSKEAKWAWANTRGKSINPTDRADRGRQRPLPTHPVKQRTRGNGKQDDGPKPGSLQRRQPPLGQSAADCDDDPVQRRMPFDLGGIAPILFDRRAAQRSGGTGQAAAAIGRPNG